MTKGEENFVYRDNNDPVHLLPPPSPSRSPSSEAKREQVNKKQIIRGLDSLELSIRRYGEETVRC